ncbi:hypothetical protein BDY19DRAFT_868067, partial [Irpex rosettiformis]
LVVVNVLRFRTPALKKTVNPVWSPKDAMFNFQLHHSLVDKLGVVEFVTWGKDLISKDYLGKVSIPLDDWFKNDRSFVFCDPNNETSIHATGTIQAIPGFVHIPNTDSSRGFSDIHFDFLKLSRPSLVSAPPVC